MRPHRRRRQPVHPLQGGQQPHRLPLPRALRLLLQQREGRLQRPGVGARALHRSFKTGADRIKICSARVGRIFEFVKHHIIFENVLLRSSSSI